MPVARPKPVLPVGIDLPATEIPLMDLAALPQQETFPRDGAVGAMHARIEAAFVNAEPDIATWPGYARVGVILSLTGLAWASLIAAVRLIA